MLVLFSRSVAVRLGVWAKSYTLLAKRYGAKVKFINARPRLNFSYGISPCTLRNLSSPLGKNLGLDVRVLDKFERDLQQAQRRGIKATERIARSESPPH